MKKQVLLASCITILAVITFFSMPGCVSGTAKKGDTVTKAELTAVKQLVIEQNETIKETNVYLKQIAINTGRIADALDKDEISTKELLNSMSTF